MVARLTDLGKIVGTAVRRFQRVKRAILVPRDDWTAPRCYVNARRQNIWKGRQVAHHAERADHERRIRTSFARQGLMHTLGATLRSVSPGIVEIELCPHQPVSQQHGFVHAGALSAIADTAAGYAALSLMPAGRGVLTTEFKINLLAPAVGDRILARGKVVKAGRTLTLAQAEVLADHGGRERLVAFLTATLMAVEGREGISD